MKTIVLFACLASGVLFSFVAATDSGKGDTGFAADSTSAAPQQKVVLAPVRSSPEFPKASLTIGSVKAEKIGADSVKIAFVFDVKNYELKMQTSDNANKLCNNSDKGQHIHFIMDNQPYKALYEPKNEVILHNGTEHYLMAFLSRSYHESIKSPGAAVVYHFKIDDKGNLVKLDAPKKPMIFYSRPKGDYLGKDTGNVLLDFYVWNCKLSASGYKVKVDIVNENNTARQLTTTIDKWTPHFIQNLGTGKSKVTLRLVDKAGKQLQGPQTNVNREFNMLAQEQSK